MDFAVLWVWFIVTVATGFKSLLSPSVDFRGYYAAARVVVSGGNPYDYGQVAPVLFSVTGFMGNNQYFYPLWFAWFFAPISFLPFQIARGIWMIFNVVIWMASLWQLSKIFGWPEQGWRRWFMFLIATWVFAFQTLMFEQIGIVLFGLLIAVIAAVRKENWNWVGIFLALLLIKPNVTLLPVLAIAAWLARGNRWRPLTVMCILVAGLLVLTTIATPDWYRPFFNSGFSNSLYHNIDGPKLTTDLRVNTTLLDWLKMLHVGEGLRKIIYSLALITGGSLITFVVLRAKSVIIVTIVSMLVNFAVTPYASQYDFPLLTLVLFWATALYNDSKLLLIGKAAIISFISSVIFWEGLISDGYWIIIGLSGLVIWSWFHMDIQEVPQNLL